MEAQARFEQIYDRGEWGHGSGEGSLAVHTRPYRRFLQRFLRRRGVRSVVDLGCGDWQFARLIDWTGCDYLGIDIVPSLIEQNQQRYGRENIRFLAADATTVELPAADLLLVKDVFQHWSNRLICDFWPRMDRFRYVLITNCVRPAPGEVVNGEIATGGFRPLDLNAPPFSLGLPTLLKFTNHRGWLPFLYRPRWEKHVLLYEPSTRIAPKV